jgi:heme A synthase
MEKHLKKVVAPVIITIGLIGYHIIYGIVIVKLNIPNIIKIIVLIFSIVITIVVIAVLIERIKEIKGGEEDDLGKY